jgi:hypothetical protein
VRYFYTDPLAAAWMAKHFGMKFNEGLPTVEFSSDPVGRNMTAVLVTVDDLFPRFHVHPDSLHLLKPRVGDSTSDGTVDENMGELQVHHIYEYYSEIDGDTRIIQRDGKPFHWPEVER